MDRKLVLIGGYAVSAFDFPRLSVDLDIAIPEKELKFFRGLLKEQNFVLSEEKSDFDSTYGGRYEKYVKEGEHPISVALLINSVQARQTNYSYSFQYLFKNSEIREVRGWRLDAKVKIGVPDKEMLLALKINSMRAADKRDIILLCYEKPNVERVVGHLKNCPKEIISDHLNELFEVLTEAEHKDSLKGVFSISRSVLRIAVENCRKVIDELKVKIRGSNPRKK